MPKRIDLEGAKVVSFTLAPSDIVALNQLAEREGMNRSEWIRRQIRLAAPLVADRLGKSNPNAVGGHCVACWGEKKPVMRKEWGRTVWVLGDGTEVNV